MTKSFRDAVPDYLYLFAIAGPIIAADQITKWVVRTNIGLGQNWMPWEWLEPFARVVNWKNTGAAFGIFQNGGLIFTMLGIVVGLGILNYYPIIPRSDKYLRIALALQLAGALGNLTDRLTIGHVVDFVSILRLPVFNVADLSITMGLLFLLIPHLPQIRLEFSQASMGQRARQINRRFRRSSQINGSASAKPDEPFPLGMLEWIFRDSEWMAAYLLKQRVRELRLRSWSRPLRPSQRQVQLRASEKS